MTSLGQSSTIGFNEALGFDCAGEYAAYRTMLTIRRFEEKLGQLVALGVISDTLPLSRGREAVAAAIAEVGAVDTKIVSSTAALAVMLATGHSIGDLFGHLVSGRAENELQSGTRARIMPTATDAVMWAVDNAKADHPVICWIDWQLAKQDQAEQARIAHALRRAVDARCPLILVASAQTGTSGSPVTAGVENGPWGDIPGEPVDGNDVSRVLLALRQARERALRGEGPSLVLAYTARFVGHTASARNSGAKLRPREVTDPVARARSRLLSDGLVTEADLKKVEKDVRDTINAAAHAARGAGELQQSGV